MALTESSPIDRRAGSAVTEHLVDLCVVWLRGEHDVSTRVDLAEAFAGAIAFDNSDVVVDLSDVQFMDASTVGAVVEARELLHEQSRSLTLRCPSTCALRILDICDLVELVGPAPPPSHAGATVEAAPGTSVDVSSRLVTSAGRLHTLLERACRTSARRAIVTAAALSARDGHDAVPIIRLPTGFGSLPAGGSSWW